MAAEASASGCCGLPGAPVGVWQRRKIEGALEQKLSIRTRTRRAELEEADAARRVRARTAEQTGTALDGDRLEELRQGEAGVCGEAAYWVGAGDSNTMHAGRVERTWFKFHARWEVGEM